MDLQVSASAFAAQMRVIWVYPGTVASPGSWRIVVSDHDIDLDDFDELPAELASSLGLTDDDHDGLRWLDDIACADVDQDLMFVEAGHTIDPGVVEMCRGCPVRRECLIHAYTRPVHNGYLAGLSPSARRKMTLQEALEFIENDPPRPVRVSHPR